MIQTKCLQTPSFKRKSTSSSELS